MTSWKVYTKFLITIRNIEENILIHNFMYNTLYVLCIGYCVHTLYWDVPAHRPIVLSGNLWISDIRVLIKHLLYTVPAVHALRWRRVVSTTDLHILWMSWRAPSHDGPHHMTGPSTTTPLRRVRDTVCVPARSYTRLSSVTCIHCCIEHVCVMPYKHILLHT